MPLDTKSIDLKRALPLPPSKVWTLLTDPKAREGWNGPDAETIMLTAYSDLQVGGQDRQYCGEASAPDFIVDTRWYDLTENERVVCTETFIAGDMMLSTSLVTYVITPTADGTDLEINVAISSFTGKETIAEIVDGWSGGLDNLMRYAASLAQPA